jgi:hypothetical protein
MKKKIIFLDEDKDMELWAELFGYISFKKKLFDKLRKKIRKVDIGTTIKVV